MDGMQLLDAYVPNPDESCQYDGNMLSVVSNSSFNPYFKRPCFDSKGRPCVYLPTGKFVNAEGQLVSNAKVKGARPQLRKALIGNLMQQGYLDPTWNATSLRRDEFLEIDRAVLQEVRANLTAWSDLAASSTYRLDGMRKSILEHETMTDPGSAVVDMDGTTDTTMDSPRFAPAGIPIPITHSDFSYSSRRLDESRNVGASLDTISAEAAGRRVAEMIEKTVIGIETGIAYGAGSQYASTPTVYGMVNHPSVISTVDVTAPTAVGWTPDTLVSEILEMRQALQDANYRGPFMVYTSTDWDRYLDGDYYAKATSGMVAPNKTIRTRIKEIQGIRDVKRLDFATPTLLGSTFNIIMIQMTPDVARAIIGMDVTTIQWDSKGGLRKNFKVMCMYVPQYRTTYSGAMGMLLAKPA